MKTKKNKEYVPLVVGALMCSESGELKPLETLASRNSSLGIEAEKCLSHQS
jgi:hypothetical protein